MQKVSHAFLDEADAMQTALKTIFLYNCESKVLLHRLCRIEDVSGGECFVLGNKTFYNLSFSKVEAKFPKLSGAKGDNFFILLRLNHSIQDGGTALFPPLPFPSP